MLRRQGHRGPQGLRCPLPQSGGTGGSSDPPVVIEPSTQFPVASRPHNKLTTARMKDSPAMRVGVALAGALEVWDGLPAGALLGTLVGITVLALAAPCKHWE